MSTFLVAHGAWSAGWAWKKMHPLMNGLGHRLITPTHTGLGERSHLAHADIDLESHIADILAVIHYEDLRDVILVGHSYGGMVATGVADRAREAVAHLVYVDAHAPEEGESAFGLMPADRAEAIRAEVRAKGDGWRMPASDMPPDTAEADREWAMPRRRPQPVKTFEQPLALRNGRLTLPRTYVYCTRIAPGDRFRYAYERARAGGWRTHEMDASHNPHITAPEALAALLDGAAKAA